MRKGIVWVNERQAGLLVEDDRGYHFTYLSSYLQLPGATPVSLTLPLQPTPHFSTVLFPFFDGLIPEGWLLKVVHHNWKVNPRDRMGLLLTVCRDCIGNISVTPDER